MSGSYFPVLGLRPARGPADRPGRRIAHRRRLRGGAELRLLARAVWAATRPWSARPIIVNGQPLTIVGVAPQGFDGTDARRPSPWCSSRSRCAACCRPGSRGFENRRSLLGLSLRAAQAGRVARAGQRRPQRAVPADHHRRRGAAAEGHERADHGPLQGQAGGARAGMARPEHDARAKPRRRS